MSDLHLWCSPRRLHDVDQVLSIWRPDVLALTGDYADTPSGQKIAAAWIGRQARALPVCWVAGNHDHWWGDGFVRRLSALGRAHAIDDADAWIRPADGTAFRFTSWARVGEDRRAPGTVVLMHDPAELRVERLRGCGAQVVLAGHLHGGQFTLWHDRKGRPQPAGSFYRWIEPRTRVGATELILSRGLGDTLPLRFRVPHEVVMVDLPG